MRTRRRRAALAATLTGLALLAGLLSAGSSPVDATSNNSVTAPDTAGITGRYTSLALDASGNPVVSHWDFSSRDLKLVHCNDANCAGGDESIMAPDTAGDVGSYTSLARWTGRATRSSATTTPPT